MTNKHRKIYDELENLFMEYIRNYNGSFTYCKDMMLWMRNDQKLKAANTIRQFKKVMSEDQDDYFEERHFDKVDIAFENFKENLCLAAALSSFDVNKIP